MRNLITLLSVCLFAGGVWAQEGFPDNYKLKKTESVVEVTGDTTRVEYKQGRFWHNWQISIGGGANLYMGDHDSKGAFNKRPALTGDLSITKWVNPYVGLRAFGSLGKAKGWGLYETDNSVRKVGDLYFEEFNIVTARFDVLFNLTNTFGRYRGYERVWNCNAFIGGGGAYTWGGRDDDREIVLAGGLINSFRLSSWLNFFVETRMMWSETRLDRDFKKNGSDWMASATAGFTFKLGRQGFGKSAKPINRSTYYYMATDPIIVEVVKEPEDARKELEGMSEDHKPVAVYFFLNKFFLDYKELSHLDYYVKNVLRPAGDVTFTLYGSADKETGSTRGNQRLSDLRVDCVYDILVDKYGFNPKKLIKKPEGDTNNRYKKQELNRCVYIEWK